MNSCNWMPVSLFHRIKKGINFHRHQLPVVTALNTPLDIAGVHTERWLLLRFFSLLLLVPTGNSIATQRWKRRRKKLPRRTPCPPLIPPTTSLRNGTRRDEEVDRRARGLHLLLTRNPECGAGFLGIDASGINQLTLTGERHSPRWEGEALQRPLLLRIRGTFLECEWGIVDPLL